VTLVPVGRPLRWLPRHGEPDALLEHVMQAIVRTCAYLPVYTAIVVTLCLLVLLFGLPWVTR
jgi:hypothetical protein